MIQAGFAPKIIGIGLAGAGMGIGIPIYVHWFYLGKRSI